MARVLACGQPILDSRLGVGGRLAAIPNALTQ